MKKFLLLVCSTTALIAGAQVPTNGLIGAWTFSGNANDIVGTNHGTVTAAVLTTDRCGNPNSAYSFNGTSSYIVTNGLGPIGSASRSLSFWARTTNTTTGNPRVAFDYGLNGGNGDTWQVVWNYCGIGVGLDMSNQAIIKGNSCLTNGQWHHIAIVFNSSVSTVYSTAQFYFDGVLQGSAIPCNVSGTSAIVNTGITFPITIGRGVTPVRYFIGDLDDFYLYNRPLTAAEVLQLYTPCISPVIGNTLICPGGSAVYSVAPVPNGIFTWTLPSGWTGSSSTNTIMVTASTNTGVISVTYASSSCGNSTAPSSISILVSPLALSVTPGSVVICGGQTATVTASGATNYTWMPGNSTSPSITLAPTQPVVYTVTGSSGAGCVGTKTVPVSLSSLSISVASKLICKGSAAFLSASGGSVYNWMPGNLSGANVTVVPVNNTNYTVTGVPLNCTNSSSAVISITLSSCTGVPDELKEDGIEIFPNPLIDQVTVKLSEDSPARIFDAEGRLVKEVQLIKGDNQVDLSAFSPGIYMIELRQQDKLRSIKLVKE